MTVLRMKHSSDFIIFDENYEFFTKYDDVLYFFVLYGATLFNRVSSAGHILQ